MKNLDFEWLTDEFMLYCRSTQLREKTMSSYEQTLHLFGRWLSDELKIYTVDKITENVIRKYIDDGTAFGMDTTAIQIADNIIGCTGVVFIGVFQKVLQHKVGFQLLIFLFAVLGNDPAL